MICKGNRRVVVAPMEEEGERWSLYVRKRVSYKSPVGVTCLERRSVVLDVSTPFGTWCINSFCPKQTFLNLWSVPLSVLLVVGSTSIPSLSSTYDRWRRRVVWLLPNNLLFYGRDLYLSDFLRPYNRSPPLFRCSLFPPYLKIVKVERWDSCSDFRQGRKGRSDGNEIKSGSHKRGPSIIS